MANKSKSKNNGSGGLTNIIKDGIKKVPTIITRKERSDLEKHNRIIHEMRKDNSIPSYAIVELNNEYKNTFHVVGSALASNFGNNKYEKLANTNAILLQVDPKEAENLIKKINSKKRGYFSRTVNKALKNTNTTYEVGIAYSPETYMKYLLSLESLNSFFKKKPMKTKKRRSMKEVITRTLWHHQALGVYEAWNKTKGKSEMKTAVIDTGVDYRHNEICNRFKKHIGYNYVNDNDDPMDRNGHGTHVAGSIAGKNTGIAPESTLIALKVLNDNGVGSLADVMKAVDYCGTKTNIKILNLSLGSSNQNPIEKMLYQAVASKGKLIFAAAGNSGKLQYEFPAAYPGVISTAATNEANRHANFSTYNDAVKSSCPGVNIYSSYLRGGYRQLNGTSMATPQNAAIAALAISLNPELNYKSYLGLLEDTCKKLGNGEKYQKEMYGFGLTQGNQLVNVLKSAERLKNRWRKN